jgi:hypothetical protein
MTEPQRLSAGSSVLLGPPSVVPPPAFVDRLRRAVVGDSAVVAAYVLSLAVRAPGAVAAGAASGLVGLHLADGATETMRDAAIEHVSEAIADAVPNDVPWSTAVLSEPARLTAVRTVAPIGAGGELEIRAADCLADPSTIPRFVDALLAATLYLPALGDEDDGAGHVPPTPRGIRSGEQVRYPLVMVAGQQTITTFSSPSMLLRSDQQLTDPVVVPASRLLANWPDEVALALDLGTPHSIHVPAADVSRLREVVGER